MSLIFSDRTAFLYTRFAFLLWSAVLSSGDECSGGWLVDPVLGALPTDTTPAFNKALYRLAMLAGGAEGADADTLGDAAVISAVISKGLGGSDWYGYADTG